MKPQQIEIDSVNSYIRDIEDMNTRYKARISYLEKELNNMRSYNRSATPERLEPLKLSEGQVPRFENVYKAENLEKKLREAEYFYQQEIQQYKSHIRSLEFSLQNKDSDMNILYNQAQKTQQELETAQTRLRTFESGLMNRPNGFDDELRRYQEKIEMLQNELHLATKAYNTELKELKHQNTRNESEVGRVSEALENYKRKNKELVDKIVQLEKELDFSKQKPRTRAPLPLEKTERTLHRDDSRGPSPLKGTRADGRDRDVSLDNGRNKSESFMHRLEDMKLARNGNQEDEVKKRLDYKALQQEKDIYKAQKEVLEKRLEKVLQMFGNDENLQAENQNFIGEYEKKTLWVLRKELQEAKSQIEAYKKTIEDLEEELRDIEANDLQGAGKRETSAALRQKVIELRNLVGELEGQSKTLREGKLEAERKAVSLQAELESQSVKVEQEVKGLMEYNTRLQAEMGEEKKKFVEYLQQMNRIHVERQEVQLDKKTNLQEEATRLRRIIFEKDNEIKVLNTKHEGEIKKLQSEIEVARDFGDSHLREIENLKWENEKLNDEIKRQKDAKRKAEEHLEIKEKQLHEAFADLNRLQKILRKAKEEGLAGKEIDAALDNKSESRRGPAKASNRGDINDMNYKLSKEEFIKLWDESKQNPQNRPLLLNRVLKQKELESALMREKEHFLSYIEEALADENPEIYEKGVLIMGSLIDDEQLNPQDRLLPYASYSAIKSLCPSRKDETEDLTASRHYGALVVLGFLVDSGPIWEVNLVRVAGKYNSLTTLIWYMKNLGGKKLWQKRRALKILKSLFDIIQHLDIPEILIEEGLDILLENIEDPDPYINKNVAEAISLLSQAPSVQKRLEHEQKLLMICKKLLKKDNKETEVFFLDCLLNLSSSRLVQEALYHHNILDLLISMGFDDKYPDNTQKIYRILINMTPIIEDKGVLYEKAFSMISKDIININLATKKLALALLAVIIKKGSRYEKDISIFASLIQILDYEDIEVQLLAIQIIFVLCARFQHPIMNTFVEERGIERCVSLYCTTSDTNIFNITGNLMLLLASAHTRYIENLLMQGGYPMVRRLFKDLEHFENQAVYRAANILKLLAGQPMFLQSLGEPNEKIISLKTFLTKLLQGVKADEELISFGLGILRVIIIPEVAGLLRKHQIMDVLLDFLVRKVFNVQVLIDVVQCLQMLVVSAVKEGIVLDLVSENYGKGLEILSGAILPPIKKNALALSSIGLWEVLEKYIQPRMIEVKYAQNITNILKKVIEGSDIDQLKKALLGILQKIKTV